jgi:hypothetical protein
MFVFQESGLVCRLLLAALADLLTQVSPAR